VVGRGWEACAEISGADLPVELLGHIPGDAIGPTITQWAAAIAPTRTGASDGRMSIRTPLAHGVPTLVSKPDDPSELTLEFPHLVVEQVEGLVAASTQDAPTRHRWSRVVEEFEVDLTERFRAFVDGISEVPR
jgi:hypothetical protein